MSVMKQDAEIIMVLVVAERCLITFYNAQIVDHFIYLCNRNALHMSGLLLEYEA